MGVGGVNRRWRSWGWRGGHSTSRRRDFLALVGGAGALLGAAGGSACVPSGFPAPPSAPGADGNQRSSPPEAPPLPGRLLYVGGADLWLWEGGTARRLTGDRVSRQPAWSPDGRWIAHVKIDVSSSDLWVMDDQSANGRQLTENFSRERTKNNWAFRPVWWPDGSRVLYLSDETTYDLMLWHVGADGKGRRALLTVPDREGGIDGPSVSPDGKRLAAVTFRHPNGRPQVSSFAFPGGPWRPLTDAPEGAYDPAWSPDGSRLAYVVRQGGRHDVWLMDAAGPVGAGAGPVTASGAARAPCWSPDGKWLAFVSGEGGAFEVWVVAVPPAPAPTPAVTGAAAATAVPAEPPALPPARPLTRGAAVDPQSGLSWTA
jgi:TolB protein